MKPRSAPRRSTTVRLVGVVVAACAVVVTLAGCTDELDGSARGNEVAVSAYRADAASTEQARKLARVQAADYALCSTVRTQLVSMLRAYNAFVDRLNATQSFAELAGADRGAADQIGRGGAAITGAITDESTQALRTAAQALVARGADVVAAIRTKKIEALNTASGNWARSRDPVVAACSAFAARRPAPRTASTTPAPAPGG
ncbi:hypothetical protein [Williamsia sp. CHRR-6]|uniref:hypothetical protein n=1 Tax=Williamsia sp. CHRR-6 TaxID=2835871 RepID=UPI001BDAFD77|nr:hypothetical protein [Williamsia sp. CHRR-6]MBT0565352.1 hypothetical protein [Williamsia sp. CHRR-6]